MQRSRTFFVCLVVGALFGLPGCDGPRAEAEVDSTVPAERQELVVGAGADDFVLEINRHRLGMYPINASICESLVRLTPEFGIEPWLATRWEYRGDNTWRFHLRTGVRFHDGQPFEAEGVRYSLHRAVRTDIGHGFLTENSVRVVNDTTVDVRTSQPNLRLVEQLVHPSFSMVAPGSDPATRPICTGPFRFAQYVRGSHLTAERNDRYWGEKAKLRKLTFRFIPDDNTRALALRSGEVDLILDVHRSMAAALEAAPGIRVVRAAPGAVMLVYIATRGEPPYTKLADPTLRRAVALAIDRQLLVDRVLEGEAAAVPTVNPPVVLGRHAARVKGVPHDPREAARLLEAAGWRVGGDGVRVRDGDRLRLTMLTQPGSVDPAVAQFVQAELARVGIEVEIEQLDPGAYSSRINSGRFDLDIELPNQNDANPAFLLALRWYPKSEVASATFMAAGARYDTIINQALAARDREQVQEKAAEAMHLLLGEQVGAIPLAGIYRIYAMKNRVQGFEPHPSKTNQWWNTVWLAR